MPTTKTTFDLGITERLERMNTGEGWWHCSGCVVCQLEDSRQHPLYRTLKAAIQAAGADSDVTIAETLTTLLADSSSRPNISKAKSMTFTATSTNWCGKFSAWTACAMQITRPAACRGAKDDDAAE